MCNIKFLIIYNYNILLIDAKFISYILITKAIKLTHSLLQSNIEI